MFKNDDGQVRSGWIIIGAFLVVIYAQMIFTVPGLAIVGSLEGVNNIDIPMDQLLAMLDKYPWVFTLTQAGGTIGGILATFFLWKFLQKKTLKEIGFRGSLKDLGFGLILGALSITVMFFVLLATKNVTLLNSFLKPEFSITMITFLIIFIAVGIFEEMFFRGYIISTMEDRGNETWLMYVVSALFFSIVHLGNPHVTMLGLINIALVGVLFAYMFITTKSLLLPIGYHITWNYFQGNIFGFAVSGLDPNGIYNVDTAIGNDLITGGAFGLEGGLLATLMIGLGFYATSAYQKYKKNKEEVKG